MKKLLILNFFLISKVVLSEDEVFKNQFDPKSDSKGSILKKTDIRWTQEEKTNFRQKALAAQQKRKQEDDLLDASLKVRPSAISYVGDPRGGVAGHIQKEWSIKTKTLRQRYKDVDARKKLDAAWKQYSQDDQSVKKSKLRFSDDVVDKGEFNPLDVATWDLNRLKKITTADMSQLSDDQLEKLLQKEDYLKSLKPEQLQAINPDLFLKLSSAEILKNILQDPVLVQKFNEDQIVNMKIRVDLETGEELSRLLNIPYVLEKLHKDQIQAINPEILSKALYHKLSEKLSTDFVDKLSDQQIVQLFSDHINAYFKNWFTSFKENFTPEALQDMQHRIELFNKVVQEGNDDQGVGDDRNDPTSGIEPLHRF